MAVTNVPDKNVDPVLEPPATQSPSQPPPPLEPAPDATAPPQPNDPPRTDAAANATDIDDANADANTDVEQFSPPPTQPVVRAPGDPVPTSPAAGGFVSSGEMHTTLTNTPRPTEQVRADNPNVAALAATPATRAAATAPAQQQQRVVSAETMANDASVAAASGSEFPDTPNAPRPLTATPVVPAFATNVGTPLPEVPPQTLGASPTFHESELDAIDNKSSIAFANGIAVNRTEPTSKAAAPGLAIGIVVDNLVASLKAGATAFFEGTGRNASEVATGVNGVFEELRPQLEALAAPAIAGDRGALRNMGFLRDTIAIRSADVVETFADEERVAFNAFVTSTIQAGLSTAVEVARVLLKVAPLVAAVA